MSQTTAADDRTSICSDFEAAPSLPLSREAQADERSVMTAPDPGTDPFLSPPLSREQLTLLRRYGQELPTTAGQVLFREGDRGLGIVTPGKPDGM